MSAFSINEAASMEIRRILRQSGYRDPVARLYERADSGHLFDDVKRVLLGGTKPKEDVETMARKRFAEIGDQLKSSLAISASERADFHPEDLCEANGITFALGPAFIALLREYCLTFEDGRFALRSADNVAHTLRSLVMSANSKGSAPPT